MKRCKECAAVYPDHISFCPKDGAGLEQVTDQDSQEIQQALGSVFAGNYRITEHLGSGGMGAVYKAEHCFLNRTVAIKVLHPATVRDQKALARFQREAEIANRISHPNAVALYDFGIVDDRPYLIMEFVEGVTLKSILEGETRLSLSRIANIVGQIGSALSAAHEMGILHRDLKPENVMVSHSDKDEEFVKVLDFGISKILDDADPTNNRSLTRTGALVGTPKYISPEQATGKEVDQRSDQYSLSVMLYEMVSGQTPYKADSPLEMVVQHMQADLPRFPIELGISEEVEKVIRKGLSKDPDARYDTVAELIENFCKVLPDNDKVQSGWPDWSEDTVEADSLNTADSLNRWAVFVGLFLAIAAGVAVLFLMPRSRVDYLEQASAPTAAPESSPSPTALPTPAFSPPATNPPAPAETPPPTPATPPPTPATPSPTARPSSEVSSISKQPDLESKSTSFPELQSPQKPPRGVYLEALVDVSLQESLKAANQLRRRGISAYPVRRKSGSYDVLAGPYSNLWAATKQGSKVEAVLGTRNAVTVTRQLF